MKPKDRGNENKNRGRKTQPYNSCPPGTRSPEARDQEGQMQKIKEPASGKRRRKKASLNAAAKERKRGKGRCRQE